MMSYRLLMRPFLPWRDLRGYSRRDARQDITAALGVTFMAVPQGVAYAVIAGLPPAMGLYAAAIPAIIGSLWRSSRHVVTGPTNAVSLLVGSAVAGLAAMHGASPVTVAVTLALLVGLIQLGSGLLRLGVLVDYISNPVVLGYITGAGLLIGIGQLPAVTATTGGDGTVFEKLWTWLQGLGATNGMAVGMAFGTAVVILAVRRWRPEWPGSLIAMVLATATSMVFGLGADGLRTVGDLAPVPAGLPPLTMPELSLLPALVPVALAATVLSLVESTSVARSIASQSGQRLDLSVEFTGQGLANIIGSFTGSYPTSGSLSRSTLNRTGGAHTRMAGVYAGLFMLAVLLLLGPWVDFTPLAALAGLLLVVAVDLVDVPTIGMVLRASTADRVAFVGTLVGTWLLPLDKAIYLGVAISIVLFLRKARMLVVRRLAIDEDDRLREMADADDPPEDVETCPAMTVLHLEGRLFFAVKGELQATLDEVVADPRVRVLVVRLKRTRDMDVTIAEVFADAALRLRRHGRHLVLVGVRADNMRLLERTGVVDVVGRDNIFESRRRWFGSMSRAMHYACRLADEGHPCGECPVHRFLDHQRELHLLTGESGDQPTVEPSRPAAH